MACGQTHSIAINEWGNLFTWGSNSFHQLGNTCPTDTQQPEPKLVKPLGTIHVVQVACGDHHNIVLTNGERLDGRRTRRRMTASSEFCVVPLAYVRLCLLSCVRVRAMLSCVSFHLLIFCFVHTDGVLYTFGLNNNGQCGQGEMNKVSKPTPLSSLAGIPIAFIACGSSHSFVLTK